MFIAEIGINHNGDLNIAKKLIDIAAEAGCDVVKFQKRTLNIVIPEEDWDKPKHTPWGLIPYIDYKSKLEFGKKEYDCIDRYCKEKGILWSASVWDINSLEFIMEYHVPFVKIASACITDDELLIKLRDKYPNIPIVMSIGMSTLPEVINAKALLGNDSRLTILHCNSSYPAADNELDLNVITQLKKSFPKCRIGYSGHESGTGASIVAATLGAEVIERHITLDRNMWGSDQKISLEPQELKELVQSIKNIPTWLGKKELTVYPAEEINKKKLRRV